MHGASPIQIMLHICQDEINSKAYLFKALMQPFQFTHSSPRHPQNAHHLHPMQQMLQQKGIYAFQVSLCPINCNDVLYPIDASVRETLGKRVVHEGFTNCEIAYILLQFCLKQCDTLNCNDIVMRLEVNEPTAGSTPQLIREKILE